MTDHCDQIMDILFNNPAREHIDVKFLAMTGGLSLSRDAFCLSAAEFLGKMNAAEPTSVIFDEKFSTVDAAELIAGR